MTTPDNRALRSLDNPNRRCVICGKNPGGFTAGCDVDGKPVFACAGKHNQEAVRRGLISTPFDLRDRYRKTLGGGS